MKIRMLLAVVAIAGYSTSFADEVGKLRDMARSSDEYKELAIDCLIELKTDQSGGWESQECAKYKHFSVNELQAFKSEINTAALAFKVYVKSGEASKNRVKRGLKQLFIIQENMGSIGNISTKIKNESNT
ncbi:MAG: hypothetical protein P8179_08810 [Candidatus Thiodiazotropha sp.]|jgi:hypothetical protein